MQSTVEIHNGQSPKDQCGQRSNTEKELVKVLTYCRSCDYCVCGSDTP